MPKPSRKPRKAAAPKALAPAQRLADALQGGATVVAHVCSAVPKTAESVLRVSLGSGTFNRKGGSFAIKHHGRASSAAVVWEGDVVTTVPAAMPMDVSEGQRVKCGPLDLPK